MFFGDKTSVNEKLLSNWHIWDTLGIWMACRRNFLVVCVALLAIVNSIGALRVYSSLCYITSSQMVPGEGDSVPANQPVQFQITLSGACPAPGVYTIRADLLDTASGQVLSTARGQLQANGQFITTLTESVLAPTSLGRWNLQLSVYILMGGAVVSPASQQTFGLTVVPYTATTTSQTTAVQSASTMSSAFQSTITRPSVTTTLSTISSQTQLETPPSSNFYTQIQLAAAGIVILIVLFAIVITRRTRTKTEETRVY